MSIERRSNFAMAVIVEIGIIMATTRDCHYSMRFLYRHSVSDDIITRVLAHDGACRDGSARAPDATPYSKY